MFSEFGKFFIIFGIIFIIIGLIMTFGDQINSEQSPFRLPGDIFVKKAISLSTFLL